MTFIKNISTGNYYEGEAITNFEKVLNCKTENCEFFLHPTDTRYGSSPEALGSLGILWEVKTRTEGTSGPLKSLEKFPNHFVQCQLQMLCPGVEVCFLHSYHPESKTSKVFEILNWNCKLHIWWKSHAWLGSHRNCWTTNFCKTNPWKSPQFWIITTAARFYKKCTKLVPLIEFLDGFDFVLERLNENYNF